MFNIISTIRTYSLYTYLNDRMKTNHTPANIRSRSLKKKITETTRFSRRHDEYVYRRSKRKQGELCIANLIGKVLVSGGDVVHRVIIHSKAQCVLLILFAKISLICCCYGFVFVVVGCNVVCLDVWLKGNGCVDRIQGEPTRIKFSATDNKKNNNEIRERLSNNI